MTVMLLRRHNVLVPQRSSLSGHPGRQGATSAICYKNRADCPEPLGQNTELLLHICIKRTATWLQEMVVPNSAANPGENFLIPLEVNQTEKRPRAGTSAFRVVLGQNLAIGPLCEADCKDLTGPQTAGEHDVDQRHFIRNSAGSIISKQSLFDLACTQAVRNGHLFFCPRPGLALLGSVENRRQLGVLRPVHIVRRGARIFEQSAQILKSSCRRDLVWSRIDNLLDNVVERWNPPVHRHRHDFANSASQRRLGHFRSIYGYLYFPRIQHYLIFSRIIFILIYQKVYRKITTMSRADIAREANALLASAGLQTTGNIKWPAGSIQFWLSEKARALAAAAPVEQKPVVLAEATPVQECSVLIREVAPLSDEELAKTLAEGRRPRRSAPAIVAPIQMVSVVLASSQVADSAIVAPVEAVAIAPVRVMSRPPVAPRPKTVSEVPREARFYRMPDMHDVLNCTGVPLQKTYHDAVMFKRGLYLVSEKSVECLPEPALCASAPMLDNASANDALANIVHTHNITFESPTPILLAYDIETYRTDPANSKIPEAGDLADSRLGMISTEAHFPDGHREAQILVVNPLGRHPRLPARLPGDIFVRESPTEQEVVGRFIHYVRALSLRAPVILHGYNSSCTRKSKYTWETIGYDMPFILFRSGLPHESIQAVMTNCRSFQGGHSAEGSALQLDFVNVFGPRVHLVDTMAIIGASAPLDEKAGTISHPEGGKLNDMLQAYGLPLKLEVHHSAIGPILRDRATVDGNSIEQVALYCVRDSAACNDLLVKISWLDRVLAFGKLLGVPLSMAIHKTQAACLMFSLAGSMRSAGYPVVYAAPVKINEALKKAETLEDRLAIVRTLGLPAIPDFNAPPRQKFKGGFNMSRPEAVLSTSPAIMLDFASLYPSIMLAFRISPFTYIGTTTDQQEADTAVAEGRAYAVENDPPADASEEQIHLGDRQLSPDGKTKSWLLFAREEKLNPFLQIVHDYFQQRQHYKKELSTAQAAGDKARAEFCNSLQYAIKIAINTLYGLTGAPASCYFYKYEVAGAVCLAGRLVINTAMRVLAKFGRVFYSDTDSACVEPHPGILPDPRTNPAEFKAARDKLVEQINIGIRAQLPPCDRERFNFLYEKTYTASLFPTQKKAYMYLKIKGDPKTPSEFAEIFGYSGFQFSQLSALVKTRTLRLAEMWLRSPSAELRARLLDNVLASELVEIKRDPRPYARLLKVSNEICKSIQGRRPDVQFVDKVARVLPIVSGERLKKDRWELVEDARNVEAGEVLKYCYLSNLTRMIPETRAAIAKCVGLTPRQRAHLKPTSAGPANDASEQGAILVREERLAFPVGTGIVNIAPKSYTLAALQAALVESGAESTFHEILPDMHRLVFDIDAPTEGAPFSIDSFICALTSWLAIRGQSLTGQIAILCASGPAKRSYHVVCPLIVPRGLNAALAADLKAKFPAVDSGIYSQGHSLRLPLCVKLRLPGVIDNRPFTVGSAEMTMSRFSELLASNLVGPNGERLPVHMGLFDLPHQALPGPAQLALAAIEPHVNQGDTIPPYVLAEIAGRFATQPADFRVSTYQKNSSGLAFRVSPQGIARTRKCPLCIEYAHASDSWLTYPTTKGWFVNCFRFKADRCGEGYTIPFEESHTTLRFDEKVGLAVRAAAETHLPETSRDYVRFALRPGLNYVRAALGSGKTQQLSEILEAPDCPYHQVLMVSFRRTFASNMAGRLELESYMDISGRNIPLADHKRLIIQVDSLHRLSFDRTSEVDLLILDEIESILDQLASVSIKQRDIAELFVQVIRRSTCILAMDGNLSDRTVELLGRLSGRTSFERTDHERLPHAGELMHVEAFNAMNTRSDFFLANMIIHQAAQGPIVVSCCKVKMAMWLAGLLTERGLSTILYNGRDMDVDQPSGKSMYTVKQEELPRINDIIAERQPRVLIYTTTLTAGVSIDIPAYFTQGIHIYSRHILPTEFVQATARVRHLRDKKIRLVLINRDTGNTGDPSFHDELRKLSIDPLTAPAGYELIASLAERHSQLMQGDWPMVVDLMRTQGYSIDNGAPEMSEFYDIIPDALKVLLPLYTAPNGNILCDEAPYHRPKIVNIISQEQWDRAELLHVNERKAKSLPGMPPHMEEAVSAHSLAVGAGMSRDEINSLDVFQACELRTVHTELRSLHGIKELPTQEEKVEFLNKLASLATGGRDRGPIAPRKSKEDIEGVVAELGDRLRCKQAAVVAARIDNQMTLLDAGAQKIGKARAMLETANFVLEKTLQPDGTHIATAKTFDEILKSLGRDIEKQKYVRKRKGHGSHASQLVRLMATVGFGVAVEGPEGDPIYAFQEIKK